MDIELSNQIEELTKQGWKLCAGCVGCSEDFEYGLTSIHSVKMCDIKTRKLFGIPPMEKRNE